MLASSTSDSRTSLYWSARMPDGDAVATQEGFVSPEGLLEVDSPTVSVTAIWRGLPP